MAGSFRGPTASGGKSCSAARRGRRLGLVPANSEPKTKQQDMKAVPRAHTADTRATQLCSSHSNASHTAEEPRERPHQTPEDRKPGPRTQVTAPRLLFYVRIRLVLRRQICRDTARAAALHLSAKKWGLSHKILKPKGSRRVTPEVAPVTED